MGLFEPERTNSAPHPRKEPRFPEPLSRENLKKVFEGCVDYMERTVYLHGDRKRTVTVCYLLGMAGTSGSATMCSGPWPRTRP